VEWEVDTEGSRTNSTVANGRIFMKSDQSFIYSPTDAVVSCLIK